MKNIIYVCIIIDVYQALEGCKVPPFWGVRSSLRCLLGMVLPLPPVRKRNDGKLPLGSEGSPMQISCVCVFSMVMCIHIGDVKYRKSKIHIMSGPNLAPHLAKYAKMLK